MLIYDIENYCLFCFCSENMVWHAKNCITKKQIQQTQIAYALINAFDFIHTMIDYILCYHALCNATMLNVL